MHANLVITKLDVGGMERVCMTLCNQFVKRGRSCTLYALYPAGPSRDQLSRKVDYREILRPARRAMGVFIRIARRDPHAPFLAFGIEIFVALVLLKWCGLIRNRIYYRESTSLDHYYSWYWRAWMRLTIPGGDGVMLQSEASREAFRAHHIRARRFAVISNPCVLAESEAACRFHLPKPEGPLRLVSVGRLAQIKGHLRLVAAFGGLERTRPGSVLTLVGDGEEKAKLRALVQSLGLQNSVRFIDRAPDVRAVYREADIFVLPSYFEGLSNALIESLVCSCPVLAFGGGGSREFLERLGLQAFWCDDVAFEDSLLDGVRRICASEESQWAHAWRALMGQVNPQRVAEQVWHFMSGESELEDA